MPRNKQQSAQMRAQSQAQILRTARRLFAEQGYFNCKVSDIARQAGMSQGNVYYYFKTKEEVLKAVLEAGFAAQEQMLSEVAASPASGRDKLLNVLDRYIEMVAEQGDFPTILLSLMAHGGPEFIAGLGFDMQQIGSTYHQHFSQILAQAQAEGAVLPDIDPDLLVVFAYSFFNGLLITYGDRRGQLPPEQMRAAVLRMLGAASE